MAFRKYQKVEEHKVVSPQGHDAIADELRKTGKTSVSEMTPAEKEQVERRLDEDV